jgi:hypothetical protein
VVVLFRRWASGSHAYPSFCNESLCNESRSNFNHFKLQIIGAFVLSESGRLNGLQVLGEVPGDAATDVGVAAGEVVDAGNDQRVNVFVRLDEGI